MKKTEFDFSIVIPTFNRREQLISCLTSLTRLHYSCERFEVIVVDDGCDTPLDKDMIQFKDKMYLTLVTRPNGGPARARNTGVSSAKGRFLAFIDDDCRPAPDWLTAMSIRLSKTPKNIIGGRTLNGYPSNIFSSASQRIVDSVYANYNADPTQARFFATNNMVICAQLFRKVGGFDEGFVLLACEDREFCDRWLHYGHQMTYAPEAIIYHAHNLTLRKYCLQHFTYGRGALHFHRIRARRKSGRLYQEMKFHLNLKNWLLQPLKEKRGWQMLNMAFLLILWQVVNALGFIYEIFAQSGYLRD
jgi:GT2 family glycosyltransferase